MIIKAADNIFQLNIPLKESPLREIHTWLIKGEDRNLLVDTAFNSDQCEASLLNQMEELGASPENTDFFITHMHVDHSGLVARMKRAENLMYASEADAKLIRRFQQPEHWDWLKLNNVWCGVPEQFALNPKQHIAYQMRPQQQVDFSIVKEGDGLSYGGYQFRVIDLAGHTPGQVGLWEDQKKILLCGDHILEKISPNITVWDLEHNYLELFCQNLIKVKNLNPLLLCSGHGPAIENIGTRIDQLLTHHQERLNHIEAIVKGQDVPATAFDVAVQMIWSSGRRFEELPPQQSWFASSETLAHLLALYEQGRVSCRWNDHTAEFMAVSGG